MIHVIVGTSCSGKSTYALENRKDADVVIDFDAIATGLGSTMPHDPPESIRQTAFAARSAAIRKALTGLDDDVWILHSRPSEEQIEKYLEAGAEFVLLDPGEEVCLRRAEEDNRPEWTADVIKDWYADPPQIPSKKGHTPMTKHKTCLTEIKAGNENTDTAEGTFTAYASVFDVKDSYGDIVVKGAFAKALEESQEFPIYWSHRVDDPDFNIGKTIKAEEDDHGLLVTGKLDLDTAKGKQTWRLMQEGRVKQLSFMYDIVKYAVVDGGPWDGGHIELQDLKLHEISIVPVGANQQTEILAMKDGQGRLTPAKESHQLTAAYKALGDLLGITTEPTQDVSDKDQKNAKDEEPETAKSEEQTEGTARKDPEAALAYINAQTL